MSEVNHAAAKLTTARSMEMLQSAVNIARADRLCVSVAIVDEGGNLIAFLRQEGAFLGSVDAAYAKAKTALYFHRESGELQKGVERGKLSYLCLPHALPLEGGVPLLCNDRVIGGIGISGAKSSEDGLIARQVALEFGYGRNTDEG